MDWIEEYTNCLGGENLELIDIDRIQRLKIKHLPKQLYKYRAVTEYSLNNLTEDTIWLNSPSEYNDPYEFFEDLDTEKLMNLVGHTHFDEILATLPPQFNIPKNIIDIAKKKDDPFTFIGEYLLRQNGIQEENISPLLKQINEIIIQSSKKKQSEKLLFMQESMKVCSFCESPKQLLMWSHYADSHRGFCVEYDIKSWDTDDIRNRILFPVIYRDTFYNSTNHIKNYIENGEFNNLYPIISGTTKSKHWEYEKEWRIIIQVGESFPPQNYRMNCQTKVYLGSKMTEENKSKIIEICKQNHLEIFETSISTNEHAIEIKPLKIK